MKIRNGFVSNSSSSSFIVAITPQNACPTCGHSAIDIVRLIDNSKEDDDTYLEWNGPQEYLINLEKEIEIANDDLRSYSGMKASDMAGYQKRYSVGQLVQWRQQDIERNLTLLNKIKGYIEKQYEVISFCVSYRDKYLRLLVDEQIKRGDLQLIDGGND